MNADSESSPMAVVPPASASRGHQGPGELLRQARQQASLSLEELASRTRLSKNTIEALENDAFGELLEPVYVRGYYRKCAKVLNLADGPLIAAYESRVGPVQVAAPSKLRLASGGELGSMPRLSARFAVIAAIVGVIAGVLIWQLRGTGPTSSTEPLTPAIESPTADYDTPPVESPASGFDSTAPGAPSTAMRGATNDPLAPASPTAPVTAPAAPAASGTALSLQFSAISWARVEDSSGRSLLSGVISAGETRVLEGIPPYAVFLGNAPGVSVRYRGQPVDFQAFVKDNATARFSVPAAGG